MPTRRQVIAALPAAAASPALGAARPPVVTLLGDSITAGLGLASVAALPAQLQAALRAQGLAAVVRGAGVSGDTSAGGLARVDFSVQPDTAVCVVLLGGNDLLQSIEPRQTEANLTAIVRRLRARRIKVILGASKAPTRTTGAYGRAFNGVFARVAAATGATLAPDLLDGVIDRPEMKQADGLHPNAAGVKVLAARLAPAVARALRT